MCVCVRVWGKWCYLVFLSVLNGSMVAFTNNDEIIDREVEVCIFILKLLIVLDNSLIKFFLILFLFDKLIENVG